MQIKDVEEKTGLTKKAIRYYEECGLVVTARKENGYKDYGEETLQQLMKIKQLRLMEFSIEEIKAYFAEEDCQAVILKKLAKNEEQLKQSYAIKQILERMLEGELLQTMDVEKNLWKEKKKKYMYIQCNNFMYGIINLLVFIGVYLYFLLGVRQPFLQFYSGFFIMMQCCLVAVSTNHVNRRRNKAREKGILLLERKPLDFILPFLASTASYILAAGMMRENIYFVRQYLLKWQGDWFQIVGNIGMAIFFTGMAFFMVIFSFMDSGRESGEFLV